MNRSGTISWRIALAVCALAAAAAPHAAAAPGDLDPSFGTFGKVVLDRADGRSTAATDLALQPDGKPLAFGWTGFDGSLASTFRFDPQGEVDPSFGEAGVSSLDFGLWYQAVDAGALLDDGRIVLATSVAQFYYDPKIVLTRLLADGSPDPSFGGGDGSLLADLPAAGSALDLALGPGGRIVLASGAEDGGFLVARLMPDGEPDPSFSGDGVTTTPMPSRATASTVAVDGDGSVIAAGDGDFTGGREVAMARYEADGDLDPAFGSRGVTQISFGAGHQSALGELALQPDGRPVLAGTLLRRDGVRQVVARYSARGLPDPTFSADGLAKLPRLDYSAALEAVAVEPGGRIVVGGYARSDFFLARLLPDGELDRSFSRDGRLRTGLGGNGDSVSALALQPDGKIVAAGARVDHGFRSSYYDLALARYLVGGRRHDADADGRRDRRDRCSNLSAIGHGGCPFVARELSLAYDPDRGRFIGELDAERGECVHAGRVKLVRGRPGADRVIASKPAPDRGDDFSFALPRASGRFYARAPDVVARGTGLCGEARSRTTRL